MSPFSAKQYNTRPEYKRKWQSIASPRPLRRPRTGRCPNHGLCDEPRRRLYSNGLAESRYCTQVVVRPEVLPLTGASLSPLNIEDAGARERFCLPARRRYAFDTDYAVGQTSGFRTKRRRIGSPPPPSPRPLSLQALAAFGASLRCAK